MKRINKETNKLNKNQRKGLSELKDKEKDKLNRFNNVLVNMLSCKNNKKKVENKKVNNKNKEGK